MEIDKNCTLRVKVFFYEIVHQQGAGSELSDTDSEDVVSLDQLSTCPLSADIKFRKKFDSQSQNLQRFLKEDPLLSSLNQKPELLPGTSERQNLSAATQMFNSDSFLISQNDVDAMLRVNIWNPILSVPSNGTRREFTSQNYKNLMSQLPFRVVDERVKPHRSIDNDLKTSYQEKVDYFNPMKKVRLSITRLDNAVSFCRTQVQNLKKDSGDKRSVSRGTSSSANQNSKGDNIGDQTSVKLKPPVFDPFSGKLTKPTKFEQKLNLPVPHVKILESVHQTRTLRNSFSANAPNHLTTESSLRPSTSQNPMLTDLQPLNSNPADLSPAMQTNNLPKRDQSLQVEPQDVNLATSYDLKANGLMKSGNDEPDISKKPESKLEPKSEEKTDEIVKDKLFSADTENKETAKPIFQVCEGGNTLMEGLTGMRMNIDSRKDERLEKVEISNHKVSTRKLVKKPAVASGVRGAFFITQTLRVPNSQHLTVCVV